MDQATRLRNMVKGESERVIQIRRFKADECRRDGIPMVMAVTSGKGGVGKTNIVGNLAISFQRAGNRVLVFDADLGLANIDIIFDLHPEHAIDAVIRGEKELSQVIVSGPEGVSVIPASSGIHEMAHLSEGHKINLLNEFDLLNRMFDILLIDTGAGISSNVIYFNLAAQQRLVVVTPEPTSITDAYALIKVLYQQHGTKRFTLLLNMVKSRGEAKAVYEHLTRVISRFMTGVCIDFAGYIPYDSRLRECVTRRQPVVSRYPDAVSSRHFYEIADYFLTQDPTEPMDGNIKFFWRQLMAQK